VPATADRDNSHSRGGEDGHCGLLPWRERWLAGAREGGSGGGVAGGANRRQRQRWRRTAPAGSATALVLWLLLALAEEAKEEERMERRGLGAAVKAGRGAAWATDMPLGRRRRRTVAKRRPASVRGRDGVGERGSGAGAG
jgi:hypothetical protein